MQLDREAEELKIQERECSIKAREPSEPSEPSEEEQKVAIRSVSNNSSPSRLIDSNNP